MQSTMGRLMLAAMVCVLAWAAPAQAQTDARFTGTVLDPSGAIVPHVTVTVTNEKTGERAIAVSNAQGRYLVPNLKPSTYTVSVKIPDFAPLQYTGLQLLAAQEFAIDLQLQTAGVTETVTVRGEAGAIDLGSARLGVNVSERDVDSLPVNGRQMSQLMLQAPGSLNSGTGTWQDVRFSGRAVEQNAIRYDGVEGSAIIDAAPGNLNGEIPTPFKLQASLENVQEFRVESNSYPAEFGTGTGGQVNVVTKSGSNLLHGSLFEYYRNDKLDALNYFDTQAGLPKSQLDQHQFGGSFGGPVLKDRAFFFGSYEGYKLDAGINWVEAVPSAAAWARAVPAIAPLRGGFVSPNAVILPGASANPDFDIAQLQGLQNVKENAFSGRFDFRMNSNWTSYVRVFHDRGKSVQPEGVSGRNVVITDDPINAVFALQATVGSAMQNELKVGYNAAPTNIAGSAPVVNGVDFNSLTINLSGSVANTGIAGQGSSSGIVVPGGLVRANSATNGHAQPYDPYTVSLIDSLSTIRGGHYLKTGGEIRMIRMSTDRIGGTTYSFANLSAFLNNQATTVQYLGDVSAPSVFNDGATGPRHTQQEYYVAYAQDEWHLGLKSTLNYGLRYDYYTPLREADDHIVKFNIDTGRIDPNTTPLYRSRKNNVQPRISYTYAPGKTVFRTGVGIFVGPGQTEDQIQPVESDRVSTSISSASYPVDPRVLTANFVNNPNGRSYQPRAYANEYVIPERVYQYTASVQRDLGGRVTVSAAYMGSQGRNLFLRSVANRTVGVQSNGASAATQVREFDILTCSNGRVLNGTVTPITGSLCGPGATISSIQRPFAEVDYKTSGGHDEYNAMMLQLSRRALSGISLNVQYTLGKSYGNTAGSNEAQTSANNARAVSDFDYDEGYNNFDVRHTFNLSLIYPIPYGKGRAHGASASALNQALLGGWDVGGIVNARSGLPVDVKIVRPDIVYQDAAGNIYANAAADRTAIINVPGGGASRNVRRPDLIPGVDPFISEGGLLFLNAAAFATPAPGTFGNLERNSIHGPSFKQTDVYFAKHFETGGRSDLEFRVEIFNLFNTVNFTNPVGTLPQAIPASSLSEANRLQPGEPYTGAAAGTFGRLTGTVGRTVGLGTPRQVQFALRFSF